MTLFYTHLNRHILNYRKRSWFSAALQEEMRSIHPVFILVIGSFSLLLNQTAPRNGPPWRISCLGISSSFPPFSFMLADLQYRTLLWPVIYNSGDASARKRGINASTKSSVQMCAVKVCTLSDHSCVRLMKCQLPGLHEFVRHAQHHLDSLGDSGVVDLEQNLSRVRDRLSECYIPWLVSNACISARYEAVLTSRIMLRHLPRRGPLQLALRELSCPIVSD